MPDTSLAAVDERAALASDEALVERLRAGEIPAFEQLMRRYNRRLYRVARAIVGDETEAEDVVQQGYLAAYTHLHQFEGRAVFSTWLTRIVINHALLRRRQLRRVQALREGRHADGSWEHGSGGGDGPQNPEAELCRSELVRMLEHAIDRLPESYRAIVVLRALEGSSMQEVAACLSITEQAARVRLHRARALLRETLFERIGAAAAEVFPFAGARCDRIVARVLATCARNVLQRCPG